jgi:hypothetical protein
MPIFGHSRRYGQDVEAGRICVDRQLSDAAAAAGLVQVGADQVAAVTG